MGIHSRSVTGGALLAAWFAVSFTAVAEEFHVQGRQFRLEDGFVLEVAAAPPLVERPICAVFDEQGLLYVAESSGSNDPVARQLEERPHTILRLADTDGDGRFDERTVFADQMMFPEGVLWHRGSLYVAAPPVIWRLTDVDGDGRADVREEWFDGKTLTGCANDLHGPYLGRDGWIYWCKGAFAEQTHERPGKSPLVTKAAHIFRRRPEGGPVEPVMTGGMDNPVEVVFTPEGERIFTATFLQHPGGGRRDGLIHAVYGGVYGKDHSVLRDHPRTGDLMPVMTHLGAAAPCGLALIESPAWGESFRGDLLACLFNLHKVTRHVLVSDGATYRTVDHDFLVSDDVDFHPTDVLEDADGSVLVVDTGGWYKLCCPTSQLWKPDVLGAIYRVRPQGRAPVADPRGVKIPWESINAPDLGGLLADPRPVVQWRAASRLADLGAASIPTLDELLQTSPDADHRLRVVWTLALINHAFARAANRRALNDADARVRQAAVHAASVWRDGDARQAVAGLLDREGSMANSRAAAEALGRIGGAEEVALLLRAAGRTDDRIVHHSLTYAVWEIGDAKAIRRELARRPLAPGALRAAVLALEQFEAEPLTAGEALTFLAGSDPFLRGSLRWIVARHPDWAETFAPSIIERLGKRDPTSMDLDDLRAWLPIWAGHQDIHAAMALAMTSRESPPATRKVVLEAMRSSSTQGLTDAWLQALWKSVERGGDGLLQDVMRTLADAGWRAEQLPPLTQSLQRIAHSEEFNTSARLESIAALPRGSLSLDEGAFELVMAALRPERDVGERALALRVLARVDFTPAQYAALAEYVEQVAPTELLSVLATFEKAKEEWILERVLAGLSRSRATASMPPAELRKAFKGHGEPIQRRLEEVLAAVQLDRGGQAQALQELCATLPKGDTRRGQQVFHSPKAACASCHAIGYLGGNIGPDLTNIGQIRTERDLLEAIVFPSLSIVRSYEPVSVVLVDGQIVHGVVRDQDSEFLQLATGADQFRRIARSDVDHLVPSDISIMPGGLDKQLSPQELADLIAFLQACR